MLLSSFFTSVLFLTASCSAAPRSNKRDSHWVGAWTSMPQLVEPGNLPPSPFISTTDVFSNTTLRQTFYTTISASRLRIQISNIFGGTDLTINAVSIALPEGGKAGVGKIQSGTTKDLTFGGKQTVTIPKGQAIYTDAIDYKVTARANIALSLYLAQGQKGLSITGHPGSRTTSWMEFGNKVNQTTVSGGSTVHWYFASAVEVYVPTDYSSFVILGDSITDGRGSTDNQNNRWPDLLLAKLHQNGLTNIGVLNQAAGGNRILNDGLGPSLISRYKRDAISQPGVKYVMVFEGVNDIGTGASDAASQEVLGDKIIAALTQIANDCKAAGLKVYAATITALGAGYSGGSREATRQRVNEWIRTGGAFDAVVDFDKILRNQNTAAALNGSYDSGDGLHPNVAGFQAIADQFPLTLFQ